MGRVLAPYGVQGWLKLQPFTQVPAGLAEYRVWWLTGREQSKASPHRVLQARVHGSTVIAKLEGIESREQAATWNGATVSVPRDALPEAEDDEVYLSDLDGLAVVARDGTSLGTVAEVQDFGAHPVLRVVAAEGAERLIPFVDSVVLGVDLEAGRIEVDWEADY